MRRPAFPLALLLLALPCHGFCAAAPSEAGDALEYLTHSQGQDIGIVYDNTRPSASGAAVETGAATSSSSSGLSLGSSSAGRAGYAAPEVGVPIIPKAKPADDEPGFGHYIAKGAKTGAHYLGKVTWDACLIGAKVGLGIFMTGLLALPGSLGLSSIVMAVGVIVGVVCMAAAIVGGVLGNVVGAVAGGILGGLCGGIAHLFHSL